MQKVVYFVAASADGFIADADGGLAWLTRFDGAEGIRAHYEAFLATIGALVMGAETYRFLLEHGGPWPYPGRPTFVLTRRAWPAPDGADVRFVSGDVGPLLDQAAHAAGTRDVWLVGGGVVAAQAAAAERIDEIHLGLAPVVLGAGVPLLPGSIPTMRLTRVTQLGSGFVELRYALGASAEGGLPLN